MNRIANPQTERSPFGLLAWLESTRVMLPLKGIECSFNVCGEVVNVELDQIFEQNNSQPLDCLYTFPLPAGAAVYRCEMHVNGRVIRAKVEEREAARQIAEEKKAAGFRTALVEMERDNLFTLSLGNVQPGDLVVIRFAYFQTITRLEDWASFRIPFCPGVKFISGVPLLRDPKGRGVADDTDQVPDASRISPPRISALHADAAYLTVSGRIEHAADISGLSSPTHVVLVKPEEKASLVAVADQAAVPDSDFIVRWTENVTETVKTAGWMTHANGETYALVRFRAPQVEVATDNYAQDVYFLIDRSGSMAGIKWQKAVEAFRAFLGIMGSNDRIWASFFDDSVRDYSDKLESPAVLASDRVFRRIEALDTGGGTQLLPALDHILTRIQAHSNERTHCLVVITDGQVGNESAILNSLAKHRSLRVHIFGIDVAINDGFLQKLAAQHSGSSVLLSPNDDIVGAVSRLAKRLRRPVLTSIQVDSPWECATGELPDLFCAEVLALPLRCRSNVGGGTVNLRGTLPDGTEGRFQAQLVNTKAEAVPLLWAKRRIDLLLVRGDAKAAIALAKASNLVCEGTAFIGWDESEKVQVSSREIYQPAMEVSDINAFVGRAKSFAVLGSGKMESPMAGGVRMMNSFLDRFFGAEQRPSQGGALFEAVADEWSGCEDSVRGDSLFQGIAGAEFFKTLNDWLMVTGHLGEKAKAFQALRQLLNDLSAKPAHRRLKAVRKWARHHVGEPYLARLLKNLDDVEAELKRGGKLVQEGSSD